MSMFPRARFLQYPHEIIVSDGSPQLVQTGVPGLQQLPYAYITGAKNERPDHTNNQRPETAVAGFLFMFSYVAVGSDKSKSSRRIDILGSIRTPLHSRTDVSLATPCSKTLQNGPTKSGG